MGSIRSAAAASATGAAAAKAIILERRGVENASGRCNFRSSSVFGAGLELPVLNGSKHPSAEALSLTFQRGGAARAEGSGDGLPQVPASHRFKNASFASFEQLRLAKSNSE